MQPNGAANGSASGPTAEEIATEQRTLDQSRGRKMKVSLEKTSQAARDLTWGRFYVQAWFWCAFSLALWMIVGVTWYMKWHEWPFFTALFYLAQATMSIGFGFPSEEDICTRMSDRPQSNLYNGFEYSLAKYWVAEDSQYLTPSEGGRGGCHAADISKGMTALLVLYFAAIAAASLGILIAKISNPPGNWYKLMIKEAKLDKLREKAESTPGWLDDLSIHAQIFWVNQTWFKAVLALNAWVFVGVMFAMLSPQKMTFWTGFYFAVTSLSTAGLEGLRPLEYPDEGTTEAGVDAFEFYTAWKHQYQFAFLGLYCLLGVPLFGWSVSAIGAVFADLIVQRDAGITLHQAFTPEEFELMRMLGKGKRGEGHEEKAITLFKFVECQLLRMGKVSFDELYEIKERFMELDLDASGLVEFEELADTGSNLQGANLNPTSIKQALEFVSAKESILWTDYDRKQSINRKTSLSQINPLIQESQDVSKTDKPNLPPSNLALLSVSHYNTEKIAAASAPAIAPIAPPRATSQIVSMSFPAVVQYEESSNGYLPWDGIVPAHNSVMAMEGVSAQMLHYQHSSPNDNVVYSPRPWERKMILHQHTPPAQLPPAAEFQMDPYHLTVHEAPPRGQGAHFNGVRDGGPWRS